MLVIVELSASGLLAVCAENLAINGIDHATGLFDHD